MEDGTVEALVQGTPDQVDHMLEWLRRGPPGAWVAEIVTRREYTDKRYIRFEQRDRAATPGGLVPAVDGPTRHGRGQGIVSMAGAPAGARPISGRGSSARQAG